MKGSDFHKITREEMLAERLKRVEEKVERRKNCKIRPAIGTVGTIHFTPEKGHWFRIYHEDKSYTDYELNHFDIEG